MVNSSIWDSDQNYVIIDTKVTVGKSYSSRGWALSRKDIQDWIPVEEFERNCKVIIDDICSDAILRFNPRLFYKSDELSFYLKELYDKGCYKNQISMKIKVNKSNLYKNISQIDKFINLKYIDTHLRVGKSYSSKGWQLSKDVVVHLFPLEEYDEVYSICINGIKSSAKLNTQFRLFYKSDELSEYLENLYYENPNEKMPAKIIFEYDSNHIGKSEVIVEDSSAEILSNKDDNFICNSEVIVEDSSTEKLSNSENISICSICGSKYSENDLIGVSNNFLGFCQLCIEKIIALEAYNKIKNSSFSKFVKQEFIEEKFTSNFNQIWELLLKFNFLIPFGDLFKLVDNEDIEQNYSKYLSNSSKEHVIPKKRKKQKILELIEESDGNDDEICVVCGKILSESEIDKCDLCKDKALASDYLKRIVTKVPYEKNFSRINLMGSNISRLDFDLIIDKLLNYNLVLSESDYIYKLNDLDFLNDFVNKYSNSPYTLQINYVNDDSEILKISRKDLASEERIDSLIKWKNYVDYVSFKKGRYEFIYVQFKQDGNFLYSKSFRTSYEAKIEAIHYLNSLGFIELIKNDDISLKFE